MMRNSFKVLLKPKAGFVDNVIYLKGLARVGETAKQGQKLGELEASI